MPLFLSLILFSCMNVWSTELQLPSLTSPVMDQAGFLSEAEQKDLADLIYEIHTHQGPQITILTTPYIHGYAIEDFSIAVAEKWQLGTKKDGNGLLITIAKAERQMRIEVGDGIEGEITDFTANQYIRNILTPAFRASEFHAGLRAVLENIAQKFNIKLKGGGTPVVRRAPIKVRNRFLHSALPFLVLILVGVHLIFRKRPMARGIFSGAGIAGLSYFMLPGIGLGLVGILFFVGLLLGVTGISNILFALAQGSSSGYRGGGGSGGGSWSGGGGGFSGGGSSGSW